MTSSYSPHTSRHQVESIIEKKSQLILSIPATKVPGNEAGKGLRTTKTIWGRKVKGWRTHISCSQMEERYSSPDTGSRMSGKGEEWDGESTSTPLLFSHKGQEHSRGRWIVFSTDSADAAGHPYAKQWSWHTAHTELNSKQLKAPSEIRPQNSQKKTWV